MAHELTNRANGFVEMAYVGNAGWHGLGQKLEENASIEAWKVASGMDWTIERQPVAFQMPERMTMDASGNLVVLENEYGFMPEKHVLFRSDSHTPLSVVSEDYKIVQPGEMLEFFRDMIEGNGFNLDTAGTLFGGRQFWALASIGEDAMIGGQAAGDKVNGYILLNSSCDGSRATTARYTTVRVVCNNTLSMSLAQDKQNIVKVSHRTNFDANKMKRQLGLAVDDFHAWSTAANTLTQIKMDHAKAKQFLQGLFFKPGIEAEEQSTRTHNQIEKMLYLYGGAGKGAELESAQNTAWGLLNAVTEYVDHHSEVRGDYKADKRLSNALMGDGEELKTDAFVQLLQYA